MAKKSRTELEYIIETARKFVFSTAGFLRRRKKAVAVYVAALAGLWLFVTLLASGTFVSSQTLSSAGVIATAGLGVYSDSACTQSLTSIDWGTVVPGNSVFRTVYVKNTGTAQVKLSLSTANWIPYSASGPIALSWSLEGRSLAASQVALGTLSLDVSPNAASISSFKMDIVVTGTA